MEGVYFILKKRTHDENKRKCVFFVSKKTFPKAIIRNKIKRQIRAIIKKINIREEKILVIPKKEALNASFEEKRQDLSLNIKRIVK